MVLAAAILAPGAYAKKGHKDRGDRDEYVGRDVRFHKEHHRMIHEYYRSRPEGMPPGLARRGGDLPPGLERQLRRNGHLPPGLESRMVPFPADLDRRMPMLPPHHRRCFIGDRAIVYDDRTRSILDSFTVVINVGR
jgi:hypothetical protein